MKLPTEQDASRHLNRLLPTRVPFSLRVSFRGAFLLLALALGVLQDEKERGLRNYQDGFKKTRHKLLPSCAILQASWCC